MKSCQFFIFIFFLSTQSMACDWKDYIPNLDGSQCQDTVKLALPFLQKEKKGREDKINRAIGEGLVKSMAAQMGEIADRDFIYHYFDNDLNSDQTQCSLENLKKQLPCSGQLVDKNLKKYSGGKFKDLDSFFDGVSEEYLKKVRVQTKLSAGQCMSPAMKKEYNLNLFLNENKSVSLVDLIKRFKSNHSNSSDKAILEGFNKYLAKDFNVNTFDLSQIKGSTFKEQMSSLFRSQDFRKSDEEKVAHQCSEMFASVQKILCSDIQDYHVDNKEFNKSVLGYDSEPVADGFDLDAIDFAVADANQLYPQFILNCPTDMYNESEDKSVDGLLASFSIPFSKIRDTYYKHQERWDSQTKIPQQKEKSMCTLLACENFKEVDQGGQCHLRKKPRSLDELKKVLHCPGDDQCRTPSFAALSQVMSQREMQIKKYPTQVAGLSNFAQNFITDKVKAKEVARAKAPGQKQVITAQVERPNLGESISSPVTSPSKSSSSDSTVASSETFPVAQQSPTTASTRPAVAPLTPNTSAMSSKESFAALRDKIAKEERMKAMETQRKTMEDMLATIKKTADVQKSIVDSSLASQRTTLPEITKANQVISSDNSYSEQDRRLAQMQRDNDKFLERIHRAQAQQRLGSSQPSTRVSPVKKTVAAMAKATGTPGAASVKNVNTSSASVTSSGSKTSAAAAADEQPTRVNGINALLDKFSGLKGKAKIETTPQEIARLSDKKLLDSGIALDAPFVIVVKDKGGQYTIPVRPSLYRGKRILTPVLNDTNLKVSSLLRKSPLFKAYFRFQDRV